MVNIPLVTRFYTSQVVQDFFHQQYVKFESCNHEKWYKTWQYVAIRPIAKELFQPTQWGIQKCWTQGSKTTGFHEAAEISWVFLRWPHNGPIVYRVPQWDQSRQGVRVRMEMFWSRVVTRFESLTLLCLLFSRWTFFFWKARWKHYAEGWVTLLLNSGRLLNLRPHDRNRCFPIFRFGSKSLRSAFTRNMHGLCRWTVPKWLFPCSCDCCHSCRKQLGLTICESRTRKLPFFLRDWKMFCRCHSGSQLAATDLYFIPQLFQWHFYSLAVWQNWVSTSTTKDSTLFWSWWPSACLRREAFPWWGILGTKFVSFAPGCKALFLANGQGKTFGPHAEMWSAWVVFSLLVG